MSKDLQPVHTRRTKAAVLTKEAEAEPGSARMPLTGDFLGRGTLALTQACWPRREPLTPSLAAKNSPHKRTLASLPSCLALGTALSERKPLISTV